MRKGQVTTEFLVLLLVGILFSIGLMVLISSFYADIKQDESNAQLRLFGREIQNELILASQVHEGYSREIFIPDTLKTFNFTINNTDKVLIILYKDFQHAFPIPKTHNFLKKGNNTIRNIQGEVYVE